jgi:hypothetical protein
MSVAGSCEKFKEGKISPAQFGEQLSGAGAELCSYCNSNSYEEMLGDYLRDVGYAIKDEEYVFSEQRAKEYAIQCVDTIEKFVIRGTSEGDPITEEERTKWWAKQKEREREEFYNRNGYYEDES